jgi:hypothetical protein
MSIGRPSAARRGAGDTVTARALARLAARCRQWGGELRIVGDRAYRSFVALPQTSAHPRGSHAIDVAARQIVVRRRSADSGAVIHEMGHLFLREGLPGSTNEPDWLGWEICLARRMGCYRAWSRQNETYQIIYLAGFSECEWGRLSWSEQRRIATERVAFAQRIGIVSASGEPLRTS